MKIIISYDSKFGNGKKVVEELQEILKEKGQDVEIFSVGDTKPEDLPTADIYIFSSPTRMFMLPPGMKSFIKKFKPANEKSKYALITTYLDPRVRALAAMEKVLQKKGMIKITDGFKVKVTNIEGPLEEGYENRLKEFAVQLIS